MLTKKYSHENEGRPDVQARLSRARARAARGTLILVAACMLCLAGFASARADAIVMSTFDTDADGWTAISLNGTAVSAPVAVIWNATAGNPGGHISRADFGTGTWYFNAPTQFLGDKSTAYNGSLAFDVKFTGSGSVFNAGDVRLTGTDGLLLVIDLQSFVAGSWSSYSVPLNENAGWRVGSITGQLATQEQMLSVLMSLASIHIRGEYISGGDTGRLDNVSLNAPVPEPAALALMGTGVAGLAFFVRRRRRAAGRILARRYQRLRFEPELKTSWNA